nr:exonuclease domain-containing protein [Deltaproteobacteria bacterium]
MLFASWGAYDRTQFEQDCRHHRVAWPFGPDHLNLKAQLSERRGSSRRFGMAQALRVAGLPLAGTHHRGIDDARNIARLLPFIV